MGETEKRAARDLIQTVEQIPSRIGREKFISFVEGMAMASELYKDRDADPPTT